MSEDAIQPPAKLDPEILAIRARPARAIRFKRGVIVGLAAAGSVSLVAVAWLALKPPVFSVVAERQELSEPARRTSSDALNALPATYGDAPKLGPPLPGDLGRPILAHQRAAAPEIDSTSPASVTNAEQQRQREMADLKAARESGLLAQMRAAPAGQGAMAGASVAEPDIASANAPSVSRRNADLRDRKAQFVTSLDRSDDTNSYRLAAPPSPFLLSAGSIISASLITGLRSDVPGLVTAQVISPVFDSPTGRILLIPQGSRLIGSYDHVVAFGQRRALVVWQRIVLPDGSSLRIDNVPATDAAGYAGLEDKVDFHTFALLKGIALATLLGVGSELTISGESDLVRALRESTQQNVSRSGDQLTSRALDIKPTITIRPGAQVRLVVHKDLILAPWTGGN
ncbi:MAG: TrbI/VirB10 family protein [Novosphingobium sp.]|nr:MAG: TrbI/VirB10 family protein [Novosphingobium sp.]